MQKRPSRAELEKFVLLCFPNPADFRLENRGSIILLRPQSDAGRQWVEENIDRENSYQPMWPVVICEQRYFPDVLLGLQSDGLTVRGEY